ncbi:TetR/AcrR family transcriptional regulator [Gryllotalpicola reticulitermitis]|uniref:TetR/AcrR family transcriptional regulator n=1 Tax=Gryllotalpicola reticulitermitis TaxID=1184153 RepID=A0ABV8Q677_9MICO
MTSTSESTSRPLRRDAARNRRALLDAGREVFAARGLEATLDEVARAAGVGVGTAYRHFANKQELAAAIFSDDFEQLVESANGALDIDDPWEALVTFIEGTVARHAKDRGLYEIMMDTGPAIEKPVHVHGRVETMRDALLGPITALVEHAKKAGCLRSDASPTDVAAILLIMGAAYSPSEAVGRPVWRRYLWLLLDGLRSTSCPKLPVGALEVEELDAAFAAAEKHKKH